MKDSKEKGITLVALVTMIVLLIILASIGTYTGTKVIKSAKFSQFKNELKVLQAKVDELNQNNETEIGTKTLTQEQKDIITKNVTNADDNFINGFRYCDSAYIKENFGLKSIDRDYLINVEYRYVISTEAVENEGISYYTIYQMEDGIYNVQYNDKNPKTGDFDVEIIEEADKWKIKISNIGYEGYIKNWTVKYRILEDLNWKTAKGLEFDILEPEEYEIQLVHNDITLGPKEVIIQGKLPQTEETTPYYPDDKSKVIGNSTLKTGLVVEDGNANKWVWVVVPKSVTASATTDLEIEEALQDYARVYRKGSASQNCNWKDEWYDYYGTTYDGENEYSQVKSIINSNHFEFMKENYEKIYTDNEGKNEATNYVEGVIYYAKITNKINDIRGCGLTYSEYNANKSKMLQSIKSNGGFWIEQYEDVTGLNCSEAQIKASSYALDKSKTSSLMYGIQWDLVCKYLEVSYEWPTPPEGKTNEYYLNENSSSWGKDNDNTLSAKSNETNRMNIYDFAGNLSEWTLEHATSYVHYSCAMRGNRYDNNPIIPIIASARQHYTTGRHNTIAFRATLYY